MTGVQVVQEVAVVDAIGRLRPSEAAKIIGVAVGTLANWRLAGRGPKAFMVSGKVFYWYVDVVAFASGEPEPTIEDRIADPFRKPVLAPDTPSKNITVDAYGEIAKALPMQVRFVDSSQ